MPLPATLVFDYPTASAIATFVAGRIAPAEEPAAETARVPAGLGMAAVLEPAVCIANMAARLPGMQPGAESPGEDSIYGVPPERWDSELQLTQVPRHTPPYATPCTSGFLKLSKWFPEMVTTPLQSGV